MASPTLIDRRSGFDVRRWLAYMLLAGSVSAALYLSITEPKAVKVQHEVVRRGQPCVAIAHGPRRGKPGPGCERLAELLGQTCALNPRLCSGIVSRALRSGSPATRRAVESAVRRELRRIRRGARRARRRAAARGGDGGASSGGGRAPASGVGPAAGGAAPAGGGGSGGAPPGSGGGSSGTRPSPSDAVNAVGKRVTDSANDVTAVVGAGRPLPALPQLPATPTLPCVVTPATPC